MIYVGTLRHAFIKSCATTLIPQIIFTPRGPAIITPNGQTILNREWVVVNQETGGFVAQRHGFPQMARIQTYTSGNDLVVTAPCKFEFTVPLKHMERERLQTTIWDDRLLAIDQGREPALRLSEFLDTDVRLVRMPADTVRLARSALKKGAEYGIGFSDGEQVLVTSSPSLLWLNQNLLTPGVYVPADRFRDNIHLMTSTEEPFFEEAITRMVIGGVEFIATKLCVRCVMTTHDQTLGHVTGKEPLKTLGALHRNEKGAVFGAQFSCSLTGTVRIGDLVEVC